MAIDIEAAVLAWRDKRVQNRRAIRDQTMRRLERVEARFDETSSLLEEDYRLRVSALAKIIEGEFNPSRLHSWFNRDLWTPKEAMVLLCGYDPNSVLFDDSGKISDQPANPLPMGFRLPREWEFRRGAGPMLLTNIALYDPVTRDIFGEEFVKRKHFELRLDYEKVLSLWESGAHSEARYQPGYYIQWAARKRLHILWVEWALSEGYLAAELQGSAAKTGVLAGPPSTSIEGRRDGHSEANVSKAGHANRPDSRVEWRLILNSKIGEIDGEYGGKAEVMQVIRWLKINGGERILKTGSASSLTWIDDSGTPQPVHKKTISNAITSARSRLDSQFPG